MSLFDNYFSALRHSQPKIVIASPTGNRNALVGIAGCIKIPACAGMTPAVMDSVIDSGYGVATFNWRLFVVRFKH